MIANHAARAWRFAFCALAAAAAATVCTAARAERPQRAEPINVATYNLRLNTPDDGANAWPQREAMVKALIQHHALDLVATQEGLIEQITALQAMPGWARVGVGRDDGVQAGEHAAIFYRTARFKLERHGDFWLSATPDKPSISWDSRCCNRLTSWAQFKDLLTGRSFFVSSSHFDHEGVVSRRESAKLLVARLAQLAGKLPVLGMGDFNAVPSSEPVAIMKAAYRDAFDVSETPPYGPVGTFNGFKWDAPAADRIDYIWLTPKVRVLKYGVLTDSLQGRYPSDHFPVVVRLLVD